MLGKDSLLNLTSSSLGMFHASALFTGKGNENQGSEELCPGSLGLGWGLPHLCSSPCPHWESGTGSVATRPGRVFEGQKSLPALTPRTQAMAKNREGRKMAKHSLSGYCILKSDCSQGRYQDPRSCRQKSQRSDENPPPPSNTKYLLLQLPKEQSLENQLLKPSPRYLALRLIAMTDVR